MARLSYVYEYWLDTGLWQDFVTREELFRRSFEPRTGFGLTAFFGPSDFCRPFGLDVGTAALGMTFLVTGWMLLINGFDFDFSKVNKKFKKRWSFFWQNIFYINHVNSFRSRRTAYYIYCSLRIIHCILFSFSFYLHLEVSSSLEWNPM